MQQPPRPRLVLIAAVARNGAIGHDNQLLWRLPEDLAFFRRHTQGSPVLMGRKTWDSLPARFRPLPGRRNLVLTRQGGPVFEGAEAVRSIPQALARVTGAPTLYVIGGEQVYRESLPLADELLLTEIERDFEGDTHFPAWDRAAFEEVSRERQVAAAPNDFPFSWVSYRRRPA